MKRLGCIWLSGILVLIALQVTAQNDISLPGLVVIQNSKYTTGKVEYVPGANVRSTVKSIPTTSDANGKFTLIFSDKPFGDIARILVSKEGMELVNEKELEAAAIVGRLSPLKVVMCKQGELDENRITYYQVSVNSIEQAYQTKVKILLKQQGDDYKKLVASLQRESKRTIENSDDAVAILDSQRNALQKQVQDLSEKFVLINLDDESETYQNAFKAFSSGKIDLAIKILDSVNLGERLAKNNLQKQKADSLMNELQSQKESVSTQMAQDISQCILKARMYKIKEQYQQAINNYELAIKYDSSDINIFRELQDAYFYAAIRIDEDDKRMEMQQKQLLLDERIAARTKWLSENNPQFDKKIYLLDLQRLAADYMYSDVPDMNSARNCYSEHLAISRKLASENPAQYDTILIESLESNASFYTKNDDFKSASSYLMEGLSIYESLVKNDPEYYTPKLFLYLNYLGHTYRESNHFKEAETFFQRNYEITNRFYTKDTLAYQDDMFEVLQNLTELYTQQNDYAKANLYINKFFAICDRMEGSDYIRIFVPLILPQIADFYAKNNDTARAEYYYLQCANLYRNTQSYSSEADSFSLEHSLVKLANFYENYNQFDKAENNLLEALSIVQQIAGYNVWDGNSEIALVSHHLGVLYDRKNDFAKSESYYERSLFLYQQLASKSPKYYRYDVAQVLNNIGILYEHKNDLVKAEGFFKLALIVRDTLNEIDPKAYGESLIVTMYDLSNLYQKMAEAAKDNSSKAAFYSNIVSLQKRIVNNYRQTYTQNTNDDKIKDAFAEALGNLSWYSLFTKEFNVAEQSAQNALQLVPSKIWVKANLAHALLFQGKYEDAKNIYVSLKDRKDENDTPFKTIIIGDLQSLEKAGITNAHVSQIRELLQ